VDQQPAGLAGRLRPRTEQIFGVFGTNWYWMLDLPGVKEFVANYQKVYPGMAIQVPGNVYYNGYCRHARAPALRRGSRAPPQHRGHQEARGPQDDGARPHAGLRRVDRSATHQCQQTIYMATYNDQPKAKDDIFKILTQSEPKDVMDADAPKTCKLETYEATPSYEM
jgi:branched-chain amino acid transport system substrate-binding protein